MYLYNSLTKRKEEFTPIDSKKVAIYVCGITPYDTTHLGHAFLYVFFDVLVRYLRFKKYEVTYTQNVTDIDDDILKRAKQEGKDWRELGNYWTAKFLNDLKKLNIIMPNNYVKATDAIDTIIRIIGDLVNKGFAYKKEGNVYFEIGKFKNYGQLSKFNQRQMLQIARERGGNPDDPDKKNPLDFLLWTKSTTDEPAWESPWGPGRPGWHIECSAMIYKTLGEQIDIHGGGRDLSYPHHESEIAQSESFTGKKPFVSFWLHAAMLQYQGEKMSKSLGNLIMTSDLLKKYSTAAIRFVLLSHHYRAPWEFDFQELDRAEEELEKIKSRKGNLKKFISCLDDDMDTPAALKYLGSETFFLIDG